jgi:hypothetical protein
MALPEVPRLKDPPQMQKIVSDGLQVIMDNASRGGVAEATTTAEEMRSGVCGEGPADVPEDAWNSWQRSSRSREPITVSRQLLLRPAGDGAPCHGGDQ